MIEIQNINKKFGKLEVLKKVNLSCKKGECIALIGPNGCGKTTLIKALAKSLGVIGATSSPTFSLVNEYQTTNNQTVYHFDFYRLKVETEALDMGADEYFYSGNWCFIEWAEKIPNLIPDSHSVINISLLSDGKRSLSLN